MGLGNTYWGADVKFVLKVEGGADVKTTERKIQSSKTNQNTTPEKNTISDYENIDDESGTLARMIRPGHDLPADVDRDGPIPFQA